MDKSRFEWVLSGIDYEKTTKWEENFLESIEKYFKKHGDLTETQEDKLEEIFKEKSR